MTQGAGVGFTWGHIVGAIGGAAVFVAVMAGLFKLKDWRKDAREERAPQPEKILRGAGWSALQRLDEVFEQLQMALLWAFGGAVMAGVVVGGFWTLASIMARDQVTFGKLRGDPNFYKVVIEALAGVGFLSWAVFWLFRLSRLYDEVWRWRFGLRGEQAVAEKLADRTVAAAGYVVFHDLPCQSGKKKWNVDHVVVGPGGVFVLETKARPKRKATRDQEEAKVVFDGEKLQFPWCVDWKVVSQVRRNEEWVRGLIKEFAPEGILVQPVIVVPGWYVESKGNYPVKAMNAKYLVGYLTSAKPVYETKDLRGVVKKLDEVCRDLEF